jgi:hypothetical protein
MKLKIVSDGTVFGTKVMTESGQEITNVVVVKIDPLDANDDKLVTATVQLIHLPFEIYCDATLENCAKLQRTEVPE